MLEQLQAEQLERSLWLRQRLLRLRKKLLLHPLLRVPLLQALLHLLPLLLQLRRLPALLGQRLWKHITALDIK
jgi:hypothetical protein